MLVMKMCYHTPPQTWSHLTMNCFLSFLSPLVTKRVSIRQLDKDVCGLNVYFTFMHHTHTGPMFIPRDVLDVWRERNHEWLELSEVHRETTQGVRVTVMPFFMGHRESNSARVFWWRYNVRIESLSDVRFQLKERQWRIYSVAGTLETVKGKGVIGQVKKIDLCRLRILCNACVLCTGANVYPHTPSISVQQSCLTTVPHWTHVVG